MQVINGVNELNNSPVLVLNEIQAVVVGRASCGSEFIPF